MVKNVSRGFFYTIGRILALAFIGLVIGTLLYKLPKDDIIIRPESLWGAII